jgi:hypothetical protein
VRLRAVVRPHAGSLLGAAVDQSRPATGAHGQAVSVYESTPRVLELVSLRKDLKQRFGSTATSQDSYRKFNREIISEKQRQRASLLEELQKKWDLEQPVREIKL